MPALFREELCAGFDYRAVTRLLLTQGWVEPGDKSSPASAGNIYRVVEITLLRILTHTVAR